jgi:hypothetical protein
MFLSTRCVPALDRCVEARGQHTAHSHASIANAHSSHRALPRRIARCHRRLHRRSGADCRRHRYDLRCSIPGQLRQTVERIVVPANAVTAERQAPAICRTRLHQLTRNAERVCHRVRPARLSCSRSIRQVMDYPNHRPSPTASVDRGLMYLPVFRQSTRPTSVSRGIAMGGGPYSPPPNQSGRIPGNRTRGLLARQFRRTGGTPEFPEHRSR